MNSWQDPVWGKVESGGGGQMRFKMPQEEAQRNVFSGLLGRLRGKAGIKCLAKLFEMPTCISRCNFGTFCPRISRSFLLMKQQMQTKIGLIPLRTPYHPILS